MANTLTFANLELTDANLFGGISYLVDLNSGEEFSIGNTASASVTFVTDAQLPLYSKDAVNGTFTWDKDGVSRGRYYITDSVKDNDMYTVTAYDAMYLLDKAITVLSITYPITVSALAALIATYMGCTISGTINNGSLSVSALDELLTIRAVLGYIAEASGCSVKVDGSDHLCFMYYADSGVTVTASEYVSLNVADYVCAAIDNVTIFNSEGAVQATAGSGANSLFIGQNPFLENATNANATTIYNAVKNFEYTPLKCELFDDTDIEVGTIVTFGTTPTLVMHVSSSESGAVASSVGSDIRANYNKSALEVVGEARAIAVDAQAMAGMAAGLLADMETAATAAGTTLEGIYADAEASKTVLAGMQNAATAAGTTLNGIYQAAKNAEFYASNASEYAARALGNLGTVQNVAETLAWITVHGTMTLTADTAPDPSHVYFVRDNAGDYIVGNLKYAVVSEPDVADIANYYELTIDESLNNYVATHLALNSYGLDLMLDSTAYRVHIGTLIAGGDEGVYIIDENGATVAFFGESILLGATSVEQMLADILQIDASALGAVTYEYVSGGETIVVYKDETGYYYIDDSDVRHSVDESDLEVDESGELVTNREGGLAGQVTSIADEVTDMSVDFSDLQTAHNTLESDTASALDALEQSQADYQTDNDERVNAIQTTISEYLGEAGYINVINSQQDPHLEIGKTIAGDKFYVRLSSTEMGFYQGENRVAYINDNMMHIRKSEVEEEQRLGSFLWTANGSRASLRYSPK